MYKKVRLMIPLPASISRRNGFMRKLSLMETMKMPPFAYHKRRFDPGVSYLHVCDFVLQKKDATAITLN